VKNFMTEMVIVMARGMIITMVKTTTEVHNLTRSPRHSRLVLNVCGGVGLMHRICLVFNFLTKHDTETN
jgi:hypothetical protein